MVENSSTVDSTDMGNTQHIPDSHNRRPRIQPQFPQFRLKSERQNAARERKSIHLRSTQLREAFSCIFPSSLLFCEGWKALLGFPWTL